jgi:septum site-determining protein MinD
MSKIIVITSGKGGVGKTTTAVNLGAAMNYFNQEVLIIDANLTTPNIGLHLGSPEAPVNLNHVLKGEAEPFEAVYEHESGMKIMPSSLSIKELRKVKYERLKDFKKDFKKISEIVILDSSAGLGNEAISALNLADEIIVVTNPEMPAITDALKTIKLAEQIRKPVIGVIVTRVKRNKIEIQPDIVREMLEVPILGMVPEDICVQESLNMKSPVVNSHPKSKASRAYKEIAAKLLDLSYDSDIDKETWWQRFKKKWS